MIILFKDFSFRLICGILFVIFFFSWNFSHLFVTFSVNFESDFQFFCDVLAKLWFYYGYFFIHFSNFAIFKSSFKFHFYQFGTSPFFQTLINLHLFLHGKKKRKWPKTQRGTKWNLGFSLYFPSLRNTWQSDDSTKHNCIIIIITVQQHRYPNLTRIRN